MRRGAAPATVAKAAPAARRIIGHRAGNAAPFRYNSRFSKRKNTMEAERLNAISGAISDLRSRTEDLRGYL